MLLAMTNLYLFDTYVSIQMIYETKIYSYLEDTPRIVDQELYQQLVFTHTNLYL